jgi:hypothetical protein
MTGLPDHGAESFEHAATRIRQLGHDVTSPWEHTQSLGIAEREYAAMRGELLAWDLDFICTKAEGVVVLPRWERSPGTCAEVATALAMRKPVWGYASFLILDGKAARIRSSLALDHGYAGAAL